MKTIVAMVLLAISLVAVFAVIGITRMNSSVPSVEATHQSAVVILGCGPTKDHSTYIVESYSGSAAAPPVGGSVTIGAPCAQALAALTDQGINVVGKANGVFTHGDGFLYTLIIKNSPHGISDSDDE